MKGGSIRLRLWSAAAVSLLIGLVIAGIGLRFLFERHVERRVAAELAVDLNQLVGGTHFNGDTLTVTAGMTDPLFEVPLSGHYWQVDNLGSGAVLRSRSLWDGTLALPPLDDDGAPHLIEISSPTGEMLIALERRITDVDGKAFRAIVTQDHLAVTDSVRDYMRELAPALAFLAAVLLLANFVQITVGLAPLESLRAAVRDVATRRRAHLDVAAPSEVRPLADEIDRLLETQEKALTRARTRATDLAHGLKTPLQVLSGDVRALRKKGEDALADDIEKSVKALRRHIEIELARARIAPGGGGHGPANVAEVARQIIAVVERTPQGARVTFTVEAGEDFVAPIDEGDLTELLGNLIENAARFARTGVRVAAAKAQGETRISVSDDGPGIAEADRRAALARGVRLDGHDGGTGLGLAIVSDIVEAYGGRLELSDAAPGLAVDVFLPARG